MSSEVKTLSFYTTGEAFTPLIRGFVEEGEFNRAYQILQEGGATEELIKQFFLFTLEFVGDSRNDSLALQNCTPVYNADQLKETYATAIRTFCASKKITLKEFFQGKGTRSKDIKALLNIFSLEQIKQFILKDVIEAEGYTLNPVPSQDVENGALISTGDFVECGYQDHINLYPFLCSLGLVNTSDWTDDTTAFHVSSGQLCGGVTNALEHPDLYENQVTEAQLDALFKYRKFLTFYGYRNNTITKGLLDYIIQTTDKGGKFNNLTFLKRFYANKINLPNFSLNKLEGGNQCIRTSPTHSMPGLLNSKYNITDYDKAIEEIKAEFAKHQKVVGYTKYVGGEEEWTNQIHWFFQEFLEGGNGVANYRGKGEFSYAYSDEQAAIVKGKKGNTLLELDIENQLRSILSELYEDLDKPIQVEFVVDKNNKLYIIQLRLLENEPKDEDFEVEDGQEVIGSGKSFSAGFGEYKLEDVLVVDSDCESEALLGKKALIVRNDVEFSHALALSKVLVIPSVYGVGDITLPKKFKLNTISKTGVIYVDK